MTPTEPVAPHDGPAYRDQLIAVGTRHGKAEQLGPPFADVLGAHLVTPADLDTDQFGTFSGEVIRTLTAPEAARAKARLAIRASGLSCGLASEASYGLLPTTGWYGHEEILVFLDETRGIEVLEGHRTTSVPGICHRVTHAVELPPSIIAGLPAQALIVRPSAGGDGGDIVKGVTDEASLATAIAAAACRSDDGLALVEPDLRAHHNPSRRVILSRLGRTLARRLATRCPACGTPGFGRVGSEPGLPCRVCGSPTELSRNEIHSCAVCPHRSVQAASVGFAEPRWCPECNP